MTHHSISRRNFVKNVSIVSGAILTGASMSGASERSENESLHVASNQYSWVVFYNRENQNFNESLEEGFADVKKSGLNGFEPSITSPEQIGRYAGLLKKHGLEMRSIYVNSTLHEEEEARKSIENIVNIGEQAAKAGVKIIVTNPNPIRWGSQESKSDEQLIIQARALNDLGKKLSDQNLVLAYHNHDAELRNAAREFHHMMVGTNPDYVTLCLDSHWIYRGSGDSSVALFDIVKLYGPRVSELHLRQSHDGVWSEAFEPGDIDYERLAQYLLEIVNNPHLVMEQAVEKGTSHTIGPVEAHKQSVKYARKIFAGFAN